MELLIGSHQSGTEQTPFQRFLVPICALLVLGVYLAIPVPLSEKSHAFMHGICAQRPSHTLSFGDGRLPFDSRMTGIYGGFLSSLIVLILMKRHRHAGPPSLSAGIVLLALLGAMAIDGFNSLFHDTGISTPYEPSNVLRVLTGAAAGVGLATVLTMLLGMTLWRCPQTRKRIVSNWWEPLALYLICLPLVLLMFTGWRHLLAPLTLILVASAVIAFSALAMATMLLILGRENRFDQAAEAQPYVVVGAIIGIAVIGLLAVGRFAFEAWSNVPPLT